MSTFSKITTLTFIVVFLTVIVLGFSSMNHDGGCSFSTGDVVECPLTAISMAVRHISAYGTFVSVMPAMIVAVLLMFLFILFFGISGGAEAPPLQQKQDTKSYEIRHGIKKLIRWLALFEHSPSFL